MQYEQAPRQNSESFDIARQTARSIERHYRGQLTVDVDDRRGIIEIDGQNGLHERVASEVLRAVRFGFDKESALTLMTDDDVQLRSIHIGRFANTESECRRVKGRVIGKDGRTRELIEELTGARVVVHGKRVSAIGDHRALTAVRRAVTMLLNGKPHASVYEFLEQRDSTAALGVS